MRHYARTVAPLLLAGLVLLVGCGGGMRITKFANPSFDFSFVERVAVLPFEDLSADSRSGLRASRLMITELLSSGAVDVVEPGEVRAQLIQLPGALPGRVLTPSTEQIVSLGQSLGVQAFILGTVTQSETFRSGAVTIPVVTLDVRMVEAETGATVWAATHTEKGGSVGARVLGTGGEPISETTRRCVRRLLRALVN